MKALLWSLWNNYDLLFYQKSLVKIHITCNVLSRTTIIKTFTDQWHTIQLGGGAKTGETEQERDNLWGMGLGVHFF